MEACPVGEGYGGVGLCSARGVRWNRRFMGFLLLVALGNLGLLGGEVLLDRPEQNQDDSADDVADSLDPDVADGDCGLVFSTIKML